MLDISETIPPHVIIICGAEVQNDNIPRCFFNFSQNLDFLGCYEGQRVKMAKNDKKLCPLHTISQEPYII